MRGLSFATQIKPFGGKVESNKMFYWDLGIGVFAIAFTLRLLSSDKIGGHFADPHEGIKLVVIGVCIAIYIIIRLIKVLK